MAEKLYTDEQLRNIAASRQSESGGTESTEDRASFSRLSYTSLAGLLKKGPQALKSMLDMSGASSVRIGREATGAESSRISIPQLEAQAMERRRQAAAGTSVEIYASQGNKRSKKRRGEIFFHTKRASRVTIIHACVDVSASGEDIHDVRESGTGRSFRAIDKYLRRM